MHGVSAWAIAAALLFSSSCDDDIAGPRDDGLELSVEATPTALEPGQLGSILIHLRNTRPVGVTLTFSSTCQLLTYMRGMTNHYEYPPNGQGYGCGDMLTTLSLLPYEQRTEAFYVRSASGYDAFRIARDVLIWPAGVPLEPGRYAVRVELGHNLDGTALRSRAVSFEVR